MLDDSAGGYITRFTVVDVVGLRVRSTSGVYVVVEVVGTVHNLFRFETQIVPETRLVWNHTHDFRLLDATGDESL
jgi:hypothetical protein